MLSKLKAIIFGPDYSEITNRYDKEIINLERIRKKSEEYYEKGHYYCSESIIKVFIEEFDLDLSTDVVAMASSFPMGMGNSGCSCGAVIASQMMIGYFFGRRNAKDNKVEKAMELSAEAHDYFKKQNGSICCRVLTKDYKAGSKEHRKQCIRFTGEMAYFTAKLICDNLDIKYLKAEKE